MFVNLNHINGKAKARYLNVQSSCLVKAVVCFYDNRIYSVPV